ncbi:hypothetical protein GW915_05715 [bacterium]|nr:hypothetical protein [bacterium]
MKLPVIRNLARDYEASKLMEAVDAFETKRENSLNVEGDDESEILTHMLMAIEVRKKMEDSGLSLQDAIREQGQRVQKLIKKG